MFILLIAVPLNFFKKSLKLYCLFDPAQICFDCARPIYRLCSTIVSTVLDLYIDSAWPVFWFSRPLRLSRSLFWTSLTLFWLFRAIFWLSRPKSGVFRLFLPMFWGSRQKSGMFHFFQNLLACSDFLDPPKKYFWLCSANFCYVSTFSNKTGYVSIFATFSTRNS